MEVEQVAPGVYDVDGGANPAWLPGPVAQDFEHRRVSAA